MSNPAVVDDPVVPEPVQYKALVRLLDPSGRTREPGAKFKAVYPPDQEARLLRRSQIQRVEKKPAAGQSKED